MEKDFANGRFCLIIEIVDGPAFKFGSYSDFKEVSSIALNLCYLCTESSLRFRVFDSVIGDDIIRISSREK